MEKIETKKVEKEEIIHKFYCNMCNKFLGESTEYDDGYYEKYGEIREKIYINGNDYMLEMNLCPECYKKKINEISEALEKVGYKRW